jgi:hypothetical protein
MQIFVSYPESSNNKITLNDGMLVVNEEIRGEVVLAYESSRCTLDLKTCEKRKIMNIPDMCKKIHDKNAFYYSALEKISPRLECPVKPGNYTFSELSVDLSIFSLMSLDGYVWIFRLKLTSNNGGSKTKKGIFCVDTEIKTSKFRVRS